MIRSLLLAALALLLAVPSTAQNISRISFVSLTPFEQATGQTVLIYRSDSDGPPLERIVGDNREVVLENLEPGTYLAYLAPNDTFFNVVHAELYVTADVGNFRATANVKAFDSSLGTVRGRITVAGTDDPVGKVAFNLIPEPEEFDSYVPVDGDGRYAFQMAPGEVDAELRFFYGGGEGLPLYIPIENVTFAVGAGESLTLDLEAEIAEFGFVSGRVTDAETGAPVDYAFVRAFGANGFGFGFTEADEDGRYTVRVPSGPEYVVAADRFDPGGVSYVREYYDDVYFLNEATLIPVEIGETTAGIDFALSLPPDDFSLSIEGTVTTTDGTPLDGYATITNATNGVSVRSDFVDGVIDFVSDDASYAGSTVYVSFFAIGYRPEIYDNVSTSSLAEYFSVGSVSASFSVGDVVLTGFTEQEPGLTISGTVTSEDSGAPLGGAVVAAQRLDAPGIRYAISGSDGTYTVDGLNAGTYAVLFTEADHIPEFYPDATVWTEAEPILLNANRSAVDGLMGGLNRPVGASKDAAPIAAVQAVLPASTPFVQDGTLSGTVRDADGAAIKGAVVIASGSDGTESYALSNSLGQFSMSLFSDAVTVTADRGRYNTRSTDVAGDGGQMLITLDAANPVSGDDAPDESSAALRLFPNPTQGGTTLALGTTDGAQVAVYDVLGREVLAATVVAGTEQVALETGRLAPGRYVVRVLTGDRAESVALTVVR